MVLILYILHIFIQNLGNTCFFFQTHKDVIFSYVCRHTLSVYDLFFVILLLLSLFVTKCNNFNGLNNYNLLLSNGNFCR